MTSRQIQSVSPSHNRSILLVDDDVAATDSLTEILTGEGYTVITAKMARKRSSIYAARNCRGSSSSIFSCPRWMGGNSGARN